MSDIFAEALEDLKDRLTNGDAVELSLQEVAQDHGLKADALRRRAERAYGDLTTYGSARAAQDVILKDVAREAQIKMKAREIWKKIGTNADLTREETDFLRENIWAFEEYQAFMQGPIFNK